MREAPMAAEWDQPIAWAPVQALLNALGLGFQRAIAMVLAVCLIVSLGACAGPGGPLSGSYVDDTMTVAEALLTTIAIPADDPDRAGAETAARSLVTSYVAFYRPKARVNGLSSFTTMQTAINSLAGHYANYANRPLPEDLRNRLAKELRKAEATVVRGA
jgi:photosystem II Psb27 protein